MLLRTGWSSHVFRNDNLTIHLTHYFMRNLLQKKILLVLLCIPALAKAQFNKGDIFLGGTFSGSYSHSDHPEYGNTSSYKNSGKSISVYPSMGFFVNERFAVGPQLGLSHYTSESTSDTYVQKNRTNAYSVGVLGRYFFPISSQFLFTLSGDLYYSRSKARNENAAVGGSENTRTTKSYEVGLQINPTFLFFPSPHWGFEAGIGSVGYSHSQSLSDNSKQDNISVSYGSVYLGVAYYFRKS